MIKKSYFYATFAFFAFIVGTYFYITNSSASIDRQPSAISPLSMAYNITDSATYIATVGGDYYRVRYIVELHDIYPAISIEIFTVSGGEGDPIVVDLKSTFSAMQATEFGGQDAQVEDIKWKDDKLIFKLGIQNCVLDLGKELSNLGPNFSNAKKIKTVCK